MIILSYNVAGGSNLSGLNQLLTMFKPKLVFLQEVTLTSGQLKAVLGGQYDGVCNIDSENSKKPGVAIVWQIGVNVEVTNLVPCRIQVVKCLGEQFVNVYGQPGTQGQRARRILFGEDLLNLLSSGDRLPVLVGDWNCVTRVEDVSNRVYGEPNTSAHVETDLTSSRKSLVN